MGCRVCRCSMLADMYLNKEIKAICDATTYSMSCERVHRDIALQSLYDFEVFALAAEYEHTKCVFHICGSDCSFNRKSRAHGIIYETDLLIGKNLFNHLNVHQQQQAQQKENLNEQIEGH